MPDNDSPQSWTWTEKRELAAQLVADDHLTNDQIAAKAGVTASQLERWKHFPEFSERVAEHVATFRANITKTGLAVKENRIQTKKARAAALRAVIRARAVAHDVVRGWEGEPIIIKKTGKPIVVPGGHTGMLVRDVGKYGEKYKVDTGLLAELRAIEVEIAIEVGEWKQKIEHSGAIDSISQEARDLAELFTLEELEAARKRAMEKKAPTMAPELPAPPSEPETA